MDHLGRLLAAEERRRMPVHESDLVALLDGVLRFEAEHPERDHTYRLFEDSRYGGVPRSTAHRLVEALRRGGDFSPYKETARRAGFRYYVPPKKRIIQVWRISETERFAPEADPEDMTLDGEADR